MAKKKKAAPKPKKNSKAEQAIKKIKRWAADHKFVDVIHTASECHNPFDLRRPCGLISWDLATGGGLPAGGLSQIDGAEGVGKNLFLYLYMKKCQQLYGEQAAIAMACFEHMPDKDFGRRVGVNIAYDPYEIAAEQAHRRQKGLESLTKKDVKEMTTQLGTFAFLTGTGAQVMEAILYLVETNAYQIIGIDSWETALPPTEEKKELHEDAKVADRALQQSRFMPRLHHHMARKCPDGKQNETTVIGIGQVRAKVNTRLTPFMTPYESKTAHALKHGKLVDVTIKAGRAIKSGSSATAKKIGKAINWEVTKGSAGCHEGGRGEAVFYFNPPRVDTLLDLWNTGVLMGAITREGDTYRIGHASGSEKDVKLELKNDEILRQATVSQILHLSDLNIRYI